MSETDNHDAVKPKRRKCVKQKWSDEELNSIRKAFNGFIVNGTQPGYANCQQAKENFPCLQKRTLAQIKARFIYMQQKNK